MICPKCKEEIEDNVKFCTKCGVNIQEEKEKQAEEEKRKQEELEKKQREAEEKKRLEEIRRQEEQKREEELKEAEKAEAIKQAKEEGIELEIIDKQPEPEVKQEEKEFKVKKVVEPKEKKKKVKLKKNIFQVIFGKLIFIIIVAALIIGGVYYCYKQELLPEFAQNEIKDFEEKLQNVIEMNKEVKDNKKNDSEEAKSNEWEVKPEIEASDIKDLNEKVSIIIKNGKQGLIDNKTGKIVLEPKYTAIFIEQYTRVAEGELAKQVEGIVVKDIEKEYEVDSEYKIAGEVETVIRDIAIEPTYFYDHHDSIVYESLPNGNTTKVKTTRTSNLKVCLDIDIVTKDGLSAAKDELPESFVIDFEKSKVNTKGYFNTKNGELVIDCNYDEVSDFSGGYAAVKENKKAGIIDEEGKTVVDFKYDETRSVHNGFAFAKKDGKWGILKVK